MLLKLVLDTNTILSGLLWQGNEFRLLQIIEENKATMFITKPILDEIRRVLNYPRLRSYVLESGLTIEQLVEKISSLSHLVIGPELDINICRDKKDNIVLECAKLAEADYIVTGDEDLLVLKEFEGIKIVKTFEFLEKIE